MKYIEDRTSHVKIDGLFNVISLVREYANIVESSVGYSDGQSKGTKDANIDGNIDSGVKMSMIWVLYISPMKYLKMVIFTVHLKIGLFDSLL